MRTTAIITTFLVSSGSLCKEDSKKDAIVVQIGITSRSPIFFPDENAGKLCVGLIGKELEDIPRAYLPSRCAIYRSEEEGGLRLGILVTDGKSLLQKRPSASWIDGVSLNIEDVESMRVVKSLPLGNEKGWILYQDVTKIGTTDSTNRLEAAQGAYYDLRLNLREMLAKGEIKRNKLYRVVASLPDDYLDRFETKIRLIDLGHEFFALVTPATNRDKAIEAMHLAWIALQNGESNKATELFEKAKTIDSKLNEPYRNLIILHDKKGNTEAVRVLIEEWERNTNDKALVEKFLRNFRMHSGGQADD